MIAEDILRVTEAIVDSAFLRVCPAEEAIRWLKGKRATSDENPIIRADNAYQEAILAARNDPYIDFGIARYGTSKAAREVYKRGDVDLRCTFLAHFPNGGFHWISDRFELDDTLPGGLEELSALMKNETLSDELFIQFFERKKLFEKLDDVTFQNLVIAVGGNPRLQKPYYSTQMDGWAEHSYHKVFLCAWNLTVTAPNEASWANTLYHLLYRCQFPISFDAIEVIKRWRLPPKGEDKEYDAGFYLRRRLADTLKADEALVRSEDRALRESFYSRFNPANFKNWRKFYDVDGEHFLNAALDNSFLWQTREHRRALSELCWAHPDPRSNMDMPNMYNAYAERNENKHPEWFADDR